MYAYPLPLIADQILYQRAETPPQMTPPASLSKWRPPPKYSGAGESFCISNLFRTSSKQKWEWEWEWECFPEKPWRRGT